MYLAHAGAREGLMDMCVGRVGSTAKRRRGGFTLTELIVVVAIIAIIAAIAFPVFVKAKEYAKISECLSNLRAIGSGLQMYLNEYDTRFPAAVPWGTPAYWREQRNQKTIQELLSPYVHNAIVAAQDGSYVSAGVFACPADTGIPSDVKTRFDIPARRPVWQHTGCSYEYYATNQYDYLAQDEDPEIVRWTGLSPEIEHNSVYQRVGAPLSAIIHPTKKAVLGDVWFWHMGDEVPVERIRFRDTLFADGHAERVRGTHHLEARIQQLKRWHSYNEIEDQIGGITGY